MATTRVNAAGVQLNNINSALIGPITGTGSEVSYPHGLGVTPAFVIVSAVDSEAADFVQGTHDATNINLTVANGEIVNVWAIVGRF